MWGVCSVSLHLKLAALTECSLCNSYFAKESHSFLAGTAEMRLGGAGEAGAGAGALYDRR